MKKQKTIFKGIRVKYKRIEQCDYILLTNIPFMQNPKNKDAIKSRMCNRSTLEYLTL